MIRETELAVDQVQQAIILSYQNNCPAKTIHSPRTVLWWNKMPSGLGIKTRRLLNISKRIGHWDTYQEPLTCYNKGIRKANSPHGEDTAK
jgi:hypothetical protein